MWGRGACHSCIMMSKHKNETAIIDMRHRCVNSDHPRADTAGRHIQTAPFTQTDNHPYDPSRPHYQPPPLKGPIKLCSAPRTQNACDCDDSGRSCHCTHARTDAPIQSPQSQSIPPSEEEGFIAMAACVHIHTATGRCAPPATACIRYVPNDHTAAAYPSYTAATETTQ